MIKNIIKRDGSIEPWTPSKLVRWGEWGAKHLGGRVDWASIVADTVNELDGDVTSKRLQETLIEVSMRGEDWAHYLMAGRLYGPLLHKDIHGAKIPTVQELHLKLYELGLMRKLDYTDAEYAQAETLIDHRRDFSYPHFRLDYIVKKYALQDRVKKITYETPQFVYMRCAMALAEDQPKQRRMHDVAKWYKYLAEGKINAPTPNLVNLGTGLAGYASCCIYTNNDTAASIGIGLHIAYTMTYMSAGTGTFLNTRSMDDAVRGGAIKHQGKLPYIRSTKAMVEANLQNGRGGANTLTWSAYDPEGEVLVALQNPMSVEERRIRGIDYSQAVTKHLARMAARKEKFFKFNCYTAPDLFAAMFGPDPEEFERLYKKYEEDPLFVKEYFSAREIILLALNEGWETGRYYQSWVDTMNQNTPFYDTIYSSNLCVSPETLLLTREGNKLISGLAGKTVEIWNGEDWSEVEVVRTGEDQPLIKVWLTDQRHLWSTPYHRWYVKGKGGIVEKRTHELQVGDKLIEWEHPEGRIVGGEISSIEDIQRTDATYCVKEPKRGMAVFNGILTGQCQEIMLPQRGYDHITDLYQDSDVGFIRIKDENGHELKIQANYPVETKREGRTIIAAIELKVGEEFRVEHQGEVKTALVAEVLERKYEPEVAMCNIAATVPSEIDSDEEYEDVCYYTLLMIDKCIHQSHYELPHVGFTSKMRLNAGVGMMGVATWMARQGLSYASQEGRNALHELNEKHLYFLFKASLRLGKELGNAPWIHKTRYPEGWLPMDGAPKAVEKLTDVPYRYDWQAIREQLKAQKGMRFSCLVAHMPGESSSKASGQANSIYPIRKLTITKSDDGIISRWTAPDSDLLKDAYTIAWDMSMEDQVNLYAITQKFTDQGISADLWRRVGEGEMIPSSEMLNTFLYMTGMGMKSSYYKNALTSKSKQLDDGTTVLVEEFNTDGQEEADCGAGGCKM